MSEHLKEVLSTQTHLKEKLLHVEGRLPHLTYVLADTQTAGKGRQGRAWVSAPGNLFLSIWVHQGLLPVTWVPHWISVNLLKVIQSYMEVESNIQIKWPNDLLVEGRSKISGILCEKMGDGFLVGVGVNLVSTPQNIDREVISLLDLNPKIKKDHLNVHFTGRLLELIRFEPTLSELKTEYEKFALIKTGDFLLWRDLQTEKEGAGEFCDYGDYGELIVSENGIQRSLFSEEVHLIKKK